MILVTGATGNVGRQVVAQLIEAGEKVRAISRDPATAGLPDEVEVLAADLGRPETLPPALRDVDRVFLFPVPGHLRDFLGAARLSRVVLLSSAAVELERGGVVGDSHAAVERAVTDSGVPWTFLRPGAFMTNDLPWAESIRAGGVVREFGAGLAIPPIDERDIAAVAVRALLDGGHAGKAYLLTGPETLTPPERVAILGRVLGRDLRFEELTREQARERLLARVPADIVDSVLDTMEVAAGARLEPSPAVRELTGTARTYAEWADFHRRDFS